MTHMEWVESMPKYKPHRVDGFGSRRKDCLCEVNTPSADPACRPHTPSQTQDACSVCGASGPEILLGTPCYPPVCGLEGERCELCGATSHTAGAHCPTCNVSPFSPHVNAACDPDWYPPAKPKPLTPLSLKSLDGCYTPELIGQAVEHEIDLMQALQNIAIVPGEELRPRRGCSIDPVTGVIRGVCGAPIPDELWKQSQRIASESGPGIAALDLKPKAPDYSGWASDYDLLPDAEG